MSRRKRAIRRPVTPDARYNSDTVSRFINRIMERGKKSVAERIVYTAMDIIEGRTKKPSIDTFELALRNATPSIEVKPRRVGGATYQVPVEVRHDRQLALAMRWLVSFARQRPGKSMREKLANELIEAAHNRGNAVKKRDDVHRMAEANKAFAHYRW